MTRAGKLVLHLEGVLRRSPAGHPGGDQRDAAPERPRQAFGEPRRHQVRVLDLKARDEGIAHGEHAKPGLFGLDPPDPQAPRVCEKPDVPLAGVDVRVEAWRKAPADVVVLAIDVRPVEKELLRQENPHDGLQQQQAHGERQPR